ncbi:N-acetyltransferase cml2 [Globisporangium polare]
MIPSDTSELAKRIQIRQYEPTDQSHVEELFATGMRFYAAKHDGYQHMWERYIQESIQDDLSKIEQVYIRPGGNFWVATLSAGGPEEWTEDKVVAMVGLEVKLGLREGELRRMYVGAEVRRCGLGKVLVKHLETWAKANGVDKVTLSTDAFMAEACKFYQSIGYEHTSTQVLREEPRYEALLFAKKL